MNRLAVIFSFLILCQCTASRSGTAPVTETFMNPLLPSGPDPWVIEKDGYYYYTHTTGSRLNIWKTRNISDLAKAERKTVWIPPAGTAYSREIWAPELHFIRGKWYMYFAADDGQNRNHRMYVIENSNADPLQGEWTFKGKVADPSDKWAIDGSVFEHNKQLYMIWSGWEGDQNIKQDIYIARMKDPWTIEGHRKRISSPNFQWEKNADTSASRRSLPDVNEGPQMLKHKNKLFIVYSANGCWTDHYALGLLTTSTKSNLMDSVSWSKHPQPVFSSMPEREVYAPGHNSFFKSIDGKEDWIIYHANPRPKLGCGNARSPRAQKFGWKADGTPDFGQPVKPGVALPVPSGNRREKTAALAR
jgi:GH43 family beta-xylosidase